MASETFDNSRIEVKAKPKLQKPILIVGLPGIGLVSKLAADNMVKSLKAKKFATLYSPHFPNQVLALKNGRLRMFSMKFFSTKVGKRDVIVLKGDLQPLTVEGQYEVCAKVLEYSKSLGCTEVLAMAGYATNNLPPKPQVFATSTSKAMLSRLLKSSCALSPNIVPIVGMAGMLPAIAPMYDINGACLLVETPGPIADANGSKALTEVIAKLLGGKVDTSQLSKRAEKASRLIANFEKQAAKAGAAPSGHGGAMPEMAKSDLSYIR
jgi:uncharacterized protein (TIGR00162 family)